MSLIDSLFGVTRVLANGVELAARAGLNFAGDFAPADNPATGNTDIGVAAPAGFLWRDEWDAETTYAARDVVSHSGSLWYATAVAVGGDVPGVSAIWDLLLPRGETGPAGANGANGANGADGADGADGDDGADGADGTGVGARELGPTTETATGFTYGGQATYRKRTSGTTGSSGSEVVLATGTVKLIDSGGYVVTAASKQIHPAFYSIGNVVY
jgi:hypothetical protein